MANITITVPANQTQRVLDAICSQYNYSSTIPDPVNLGAAIPNPETQAQFVQRKMREWIKDVVAAHEASIARKTAGDTALAKVASEITIT